MKDRIEAYIRENITKDKLNNEELHYELLSNSYDRYDEYINEGIEPSKAYYKTILLLGDFEEDVEYTKNEINHFKLLILVLVGLLFVNSIAFTLYSKGMSKLIIILAIMVSLIIVIIYHYMIDTHNSQYQRLWIKHGSIISIVMGIFISLHLFQLFSPFLASSTYYNHLAEYIFFGSVLGYLMSFIGFCVFIEPKKVYQNMVKVPLEIIVLGMGIALFTSINYFDYLQSHDYSIFTLTSSVLILIVFFISLIRSFNNKSKYRIIYIVTILTSLIVFGELLYLNIVKPTSITYTNYLVSVYQLGRIAIFLSLVFYGYKIFKNKTQKFNLFPLIIIGISNIIQLRMIYTIPFNLRIMMNNNPGLIASIPFNMKETFTNTYIFILILVCLQHLIPYIIRELQTKEA